MMNGRSAGFKIGKLSQAFKADGFAIAKRIFTQSGKLGILAEHQTERNKDTGAPKKSYYLEGKPYERGYLLGLLAEPEVSDMAVNFVDNILFDFLGLEFLNSIPLLQKMLAALLYELSESAWKSQPQHIHDEVRGILEGCRRSNPNTPVTESRLGVINVGFDVLCALIYTGRFLREFIPGLSPEHVRLSMMCNAFSVFGAAAGGEHFFARDFMFATGGVLQRNLAHMLHNPESGRSAAERLHPHVSISAPGIVGSISAMNMQGVAAGLNMSPAANCDPEHVGMNSLLLLRESILRGGSGEEAARVVESAQRGVSWNYVFSDGKNDAACTVEAGASWDHVDFWGYPPSALLPYLPSASFLANHNPSPMKNGAMTRRYGAPFPEEYFAFNPGLWEYYNREHSGKVTLYPNAFTPGGFINRTRQEKNCPSNYYFAPERTEKDVFITTNHFLLPHMRLCAMDPWTALITRRNVNDIQWRYDELNHQIRQELSERGRIGHEAAKCLAEFLAPYGKFPDYYAKNPKSEDGADTRIEGCVSLFDLKKRTVESHYGYYKDEWIKTTLPAYF